MSIIFLSMVNYVIGRSLLKLLNNADLTYQIDSWIADFYLMSNDYSTIIGRPTVTLVGDVNSQTIAGLDVNMAKSYLNSVRAALANSFTSKVGFCEQYGITITDNDWPCISLPKRLILDRSPNIESIINSLSNLGIEIIVVPPMKVDLKAIVEHQFNIVNNLEFVQSKTKMPRGGHDYRLDVKLNLNLNDFYRLIIPHVLKYNNERRLANCPQ